MRLAGKRLQTRLFAYHIQFQRTHVRVQRCLIVHLQKSPFKYATAVGLQASAVGLVVSTLQNALGNHSHGAMGVVTRTGGTIGLFGAFSLPNLHVGC